MKKILLFGFHDFASSMTVYKLTEDAKKVGILVENVDQEDYLRPLGILSGAVPANAPFANVMEEEYEGNELPVRMLLFVGLSEKELDQAMELCNQNGITKHDLKAILTPYNVAWNAVSLCQELIIEHAQMNPGRL